MKNIWGIPKKILKETYKEYKFNLTGLNFYQILTLDEVVFKAMQANPLDLFKAHFDLDEGLIKTYPAKQVKDILVRTFDLNPKQIILYDIPQGDQKIIIALFLPDVGDNINRISGMMKVCGYTLARSDEHTIDGDKWVSLSFTPNFQAPRDMGDEYALWHISPKRYEESILRNGFIPYSRNTVFKYPDRIYFFKGSLPKEEVIKLGRTLYMSSNTKSSEYVDLSKYVLYRVALHKVPSRVRFYSDPDWTEAAIYTPDNIPSSAIISKEDVYYSK